MFTKLLAFITAFGVLAAGAVGVWSAADYLEVRPVLEKEFNVLQKQAGDIGITVLVLRFYLLLDKRKQNGSLSYEDQAELCRIATELKYIGVPGCEA
jgi:hypothetical protein